MSHTRRRHLQQIAATGGAATLATSIGVACGLPGRGPAASERRLKTGITLQWGGTGTGQSRVDLQNRLAQMFMQRYPGITIETIPDGENMDKLQAGIAAGAPLDLTSINEMRYAGLASSGALVPLDPLAKRDRYDFKEFLPRSLVAWNWRGKQYGMPFLGLLTPYLNLTLTQQSGARRPPNSWSDRSWDWNAFLEYCLKVTRREGDRVMQWGFTGPYNNVRLIGSWLWSAGGDYFDKDLTRLTLTESAAMEGLQFQADLINKYRVMPHPSEVSQLGGFFGPFNTNRAGIGVVSSSMIGALRRVAGLNWTVTAMPRGKGGAVIGGGGSAWFMLAAGRYHDEAWELLKLVQSPEADKLSALSGETLPARRSVAKDPELLTPKEAPGADMKLIFESVETSLKTLPVLIQGEEIYNRIIQPELQTVWTGERSVRDAVTTIKARVEPLLPKERA
ncbi:MAG: extracellular solute-binding protein [Chloroflexi bacterium]|nr:extracellular solute-binding protein [Chloroflexota bacterium]